MDLETALRDIHAALSRAARWPTHAATDDAASHAHAAAAAVDLEAGGLSADAAAPAPSAAPSASALSARAALRGARRAVLFAALLALGLPAYFLLCAVWVVPYLAVSFWGLDTVTAAAAAGAPPPGDVLEALPHAADAAATLAAALLAAACGDAPARQTAHAHGDADADAAGDGASAVPAWRQAGSAPARLAKGCFVALFALVAAPPMAALWLAAAPLRFVSALATEPEAYLDEPPQQRAAAAAPEELV
jgi:hypothetical protein